MAKNKWVIGDISPAVWPMFPSVQWDSKPNPTGCDLRGVAAPGRSINPREAKPLKIRGGEKKKREKKYQKCWDITLKKVTTIGDTPIFNFHEYGRNGNFIGLYTWFSKPYILPTKGDYMLKDDLLQEPEKSGKSWDLTSVYLPHPGCLPSQVKV